MTDFSRRAGDMFKSTYDTDADGAVDNSELLEGESVAEVQDHAPKSHGHTQSDVANLETALAGKSDDGHEHVEADITNLDHDAQKVKGVIINDAAKADQKVLAYDSGTDRIVYIEQAPSGASIKSIQRFDETFGATTIKDVTIAEVDASKTMILFNGYKPAALYDDDKMITVRLYNNTTVRLQRKSPDHAPRVGFTVIEFESGIKNIQRGHTTITNGGQVDVTITEVDLAKAFVSWLGLTGESGVNFSCFTIANLLDSTTLRIETSYINLDGYMSWEVVEFE